MCFLLITINIVERTLEQKFTLLLNLSIFILFGSSAQ